MVASQFMITPARRCQMLWAAGPCHCITYMLLVLSWAVSWQFCLGAKCGLVLVSGRLVVIQSPHFLLLCQPLLHGCPCIGQLLISHSEPSQDATESVATDIYTEDDDFVSEGEAEPA
eukprot:scaffold45019_cov48-Prasinocladus_malaysianus.AAC.1